MTVGEDAVAENFDKELIGKKPEKEFSVKLPISKDEVDEDVTGKEIVYSVKINYIENEIEIELTDEFVAQNLFDSYQCKTVKELKNAVKMKWNLPMQKF